MTMDGLAVVVSPLISLMTDQVDALTGCGIAASRLDSSLSQDHRDGVFRRIGNGRIKILHLSPERTMAGGFIDCLNRVGVCMIAIDHAHCVSMWGRHTHLPSVNAIQLAFFSCNWRQARVALSDLYQYYMSLRKERDTGFFLFLEITRFAAGCLDATCRER